MKIKNAIWFFAFFIGFVKPLKAQLTSNPCIENTAFKCVVLGSSTAAGSGPSHPDSAWVNKYRNALKQINPQNEVINLAVGGYTTYKIMPDSFSTPPNRPLVDFSHNITSALNLNPDYIIVNLPSNDRQWPMAEQLSNFDSLFNHSWNSGVPMYICTTQPIVGASAAAYQRAVRDSILSMFSPYFIEFFLPLADTNNTVRSTFAADAVHLNDSGHAVLFTQVWNKDILKDVFSPRPFPDLALVSVELPFSQCADSVTTFGWAIANLGDSVAPGIIGYAKTNLNGLIDSVPMILQGGLGSCEVDTIWTLHNLSVAGNYILEGKVAHPLDSNFANNTISTAFTTVESPRFLAHNDTLCRGDFAQFSAQLVSGDTLLWYGSANDSVPLPTAMAPFSLQKDTSIFVQAVTGNLFYSDQLSTLATANINFNGNMFDLLGLADVDLKSIKVRSFSTGSVPINVYSKQGSYRGFEATQSAWTLVFQDTLQVANSGDFVALEIPSISIGVGDTLGFYVHMAQSGKQLMYQSVAQPASFASSELLFLSGSGIAYQFGAVYDNRVINASFDYSFGFNRLGDCASNREEVWQAISREKLNLGPDTVLPFSGLSVSAPGSFTNHSWVNLDNGDTISIQNSAFIDSSQIVFPATSQAQIACFALDNWGCEISDTVVYTFVHNYGLAENELSAFVYPNPATDKIEVRSLEPISSYTIFDLSGRKMKSADAHAKHFQIDVQNLAMGVYLILLKSGDRFVVQRIIKR